MWKTAWAGLAAAAWLAIPPAVQAQQAGTSISEDGAAPNANAMLGIQWPAEGDGKGLLIPRVTKAQRTTANRTQWIDAGPPATQPSALSQIRAYRVKEVAE